MQRGSRQKREDENLKYIGSGEDPPNAFIVKFISDTVGKFASTFSTFLYLDHLKYSFLFKGSFKYHMTLKDQ